jgi:hypothetical protein
MTPAETCTLANATSTSRSLSVANGEVAGHERALIPTSRSEPLLRRRTLTAHPALVS